MTTTTTRRLRCARLCECAPTQLSPRAQGGAAALGVHRIHVRGQLRFVRKIAADKHDPAVHGTWGDAHVDGSAGVEAHSGDLVRLTNRALPATHDRRLSRSAPTPTSLS